MVLPPLPEPHAIAVMVLTLVVLFLFTRERIPLETSSLIVLVIMTIGFTLFPYMTEGGHMDAVSLFHGFGHEALIAVCALMIAGQGMVRTGALEPVGRLLARLWAYSPGLSLIVTLVIGAVLSAFVNNTPIVVLLLPILISVSLRTKTRASGVLMPMGFATLVGGMSTTIGTSTNLLVVSVAADMGLERFGMFDFMMPAAFAGVLALIYLWLVAPLLLPERKPLLSDTSPRIFQAQLYITEEAFANGKTLSEVIKKTDDQLKVARIQRGEHTSLVPLPDVVLQADDRLTVQDTPDRLKEFETLLGAALYTGGSRVDEEHPLSAGDQQLAEVVVVQSSFLEGSTLRRARFADRYGLVILALHRAGWVKQTLYANIGDVTLKTGDVLLVQGARDQIAELKRNSELLVLDATADLPHTTRAAMALGIMTAIVGLAAFGILPIAISAVAGVLAMLATRCLSWDDATRSLSTPVIMIVVVSLALGNALLQTGAAEYIAQVFVAVSLGAPPAIVLSALMLLMAVLTNIVSNNAAAVIGTPIAISMAQQLGLPAEPFVLAVLFGANMSYATPIAYKTNMLVMTSGGYVFSDFLRVGIPLTAIMWLTLSWLLPRLYGF
ncbi:MAG: SLC13 family permease [Gammaproteobacteria bacterium]|nr:SLC13 family permease [Gammaproteobacteria bacterium]MDH3559849.1 SLC13 family permease [Gammaproteobacteria bacterium]